MCVHGVSLSHRVYLSNIILHQELLTGSTPFSEHEGTEYALARDIANGHLPNNPGSPAVERGLTQECWELLLDCWDVDPSMRPPATRVVRRIWELQ